MKNTIKKKIMTLAVAPMLLGLVGCGISQKPAADANSSQTEKIDAIEQNALSDTEQTDKNNTIEQNTLSDTEQTGKNTQNKLSDEDLDSQIQLLLDNKDKWDTQNTEAQYCVWDLDHNGRLEIISYYTEGSAGYNNGAMYEVTEDMTGLQECELTSKYSDGNTYPETVVDSVTMGHSSADDSYYYSFSSLSSSAERGMIETSVILSLKDGVAREDFLDSKITSLETEASEYEDDDYNPITQKEYEQCVSNYMSSKEAETSTVKLTWFSLDDESSLKDTMIAAYNTFISAE